MKVISVTKESLQGVIATAFLIIRSFTVAELEEDPRELLGSATWQLMLEVTAVHDAERHACDDALDSVDWGSDTLMNGVRKLRCTKCGSDLLLPAGAADTYADVTLSCRVCGDVMKPEVFIPRAVEAELEWGSYMAAEDGAEGPIAECPECGISAYVIAEGRCAHCGSTVEQECSRCECTIPASELGSSPLCGYCEHMMAKDD